MMGVNTGYRGHNINVEWAPNDQVTIDIKGPVLTDGYTMARDKTATRWSDPAIAWADARIDLAIETHAHTYSSLTVGCSVCKGGAVQTAAMTPKRIDALEVACAELESEYAGTSAFEPGGNIRIAFDALMDMLAEARGEVPA